MNLLDAVVVQVLGAPVQKYGKWWVTVEYESWGITSTANVMCDTPNDALEVKVGYKFLC